MENWNLHFKGNALGAQPLSQSSWAFSGEGAGLTQVPGADLLLGHLTWSATRCPHSTN